MIKLFKKLSVILIFTLILGVSSVFASGKMEVKIGDTVDLAATGTSVSATYKWVVNKGKSILNTQTGANFSYKFTNQGEHTVNLTSTDGSNVESTSVSVLVGEKYKTDVTTKQGTGTSGTGPYLVLETLPQMDSNKQIAIYGDSGKVSFILEGSVGDILEYRIDKNIYEDSDGNGTANDDIDNSGDSSYLTGQAWAASYKKGKSAKIAALITLVDKKGQKATEQAEIVFKDLTATGDLTAILDVSPAADAKDGLVHLYQDTHKVAFYARRSTGKILEYRIDKNIFEDSDNDGDPKNDIDNLKDVSFTGGDVWITSYTKTSSQIIAQLIIVSSDGKGSRIQKGITFGLKPTPPAPSLSDSGVKSGIYLSADKSTVYKDDPITFTVQGLQLGMSEYTFQWDFDGDGKTDKEITGTNTIKNTYTKLGVNKVKVIISDKKSNKADKTLDITVKDKVATKADFTYQINGLKVTFTNLSTASQSLASSQLTYNWNFGDTDVTGYTNQKDQMTVTNPTYTYAKAGKYIVSLTVTDSDKVTDTKTETIEIKQAAGSQTSATTSGASGTSASTGKTGTSSVFIKILKIILYLVIIIIALVLIIVGGFLTFLKVQQPDLTFAELIDELKIKILTKIGAYDEHEKTGVGAGHVQPGNNDENKNGTTESVGNTEEEDQTEEGAEEPEIPISEKGPTPSWMQNKNIIEGETVEETQVSDEYANEEESEAPLDETTPSWMQEQEEAPAEDEALDEGDIAEGAAETAEESAEPDVPDVGDDVGDADLRPDNGKTDENAEPDAPDVGTSHGLSMDDENIEPTAENTPQNNKPQNPSGNKPQTPGGEQGPVPDWLKGV